MQIQQVVSTEKVWWGGEILKILTDFMALFGICKFWKSYSEVIKPILLLNYSKFLKSIKRSQIKIVSG